MIVWNCGAIVVPDITWVQASGRQRLNGAQKVDTQEVFLRLNILLVETDFTGLSLWFHIH